jgi:hypothetical protein
MVVSGPKTDCRVLGQPLGWGRDAGSVKADMKSVGSFHSEVKRTRANEVVTESGTALIGSFGVRTRWGIDRGAWTSAY